MTKRSLNKKTHKPRSNSGSAAFHAQNHTSRSNTARQSGICSVFETCGACECINEPYEKQLEHKQAFVADLFEEFAGETCLFEPIAGMQKPFGFRNKIVSPFAPGKRLAAAGHTKSAKAAKGQQRKQEREILHGMYERGTHHITALKQCPVEHPSGRKIVHAVADLMRKYGIPAYDEDAGTGFLRHVMVRVGHESNEVLVTLVTNAREFKGAKNFARELVKRCPEITTVVQNVNTRQTNVILGEEEHTLYGPGFILDTLCGLSFRISSHSFYQVNAVQTEVLYRTAIDWALEDLQSSEDAQLRIMDAYCGTGTIGLVAAHQAGNAQVVGVDKVESAIADARQNARHNGIENATFVVDDAGMYLRSAAAEGQRFDVVLMDPPRAGSSEQFLRALADADVERVVYISCNPQTQARDVEYLQGLGYVLERMRPVDMFPHTEHVENIALMAKEQSR